MLLALELLDLFADRASLLLGVPGGMNMHLLVVGIRALGKERLAEPALVMGNQMRRRAEDMLGRAVVALQLVTLAPGKSFSKRRMLSTSAPRQP